MKKNQLILPDIINLSKASSFTMIPNELLRNPEISCVAKTIQCILLSNERGWKSYISVIEGMIKESAYVISKALTELEEAGYLKRIRVRDAKTKVIKGSFWGYGTSPNEFDFKGITEYLENHGCEMVQKSSANTYKNTVNALETPTENYKAPIENSLHLRVPHRGLPHCGELTNKNINNKNINNKNTNKEIFVVVDKKIKKDQFEYFWKLYPKKVNKGKAKAAWIKLCNKKDAPNWSEIRKALTEQIKTEQWQNSQYIAHPTTWLNNFGWLNDPEQMISYTPATSKQKLSNSMGKRYDYTSLNIQTHE